MPEIAVTSLPLRLQRQVEQARAAFDRGNHEYTSNLCREILRQHPGCLAVRRLLRASQLKAFKARNPLLARATGVVRSAPALVTALALRAKNPAAALLAVERALEADPSNPTALRILADAALAMDLPETAVFALEAARERKPENRAVLVRLAEAYIAAGRANEGLAIAERLARQTPDDAQVKELLKNASVAQSIGAGRWDSGSGTFRDKLRDESEAVSLEQAAKAVRSADMTRRLVEESIARLQTEPSNLNLYRAVVDGYRSLGEIEDALTWLARARALPTGAADVTLEKLESDLRLERTARRVREREQELAASGGDPATDAELARLRAEHRAARCAELQAFVDRYPNEQGYRFDLARLLVEAGEIDQAIQHFQQAQRHPKLRIPTLLQLGACFQAKGILDLAVHQYETAKQEIVAFDENKKEAIYQLGCCLEAMGQGERAVEEFKLVYSADIGFRDVAAKIDRFYSSQKK